MPLQNTSTLTNLQQAIFNRISHDFPFMPASQATNVADHNLIKMIQDGFDEIESKPLNTYDASYMDVWFDNRTNDWTVDWLLERVTENETCLIFLIDDSGDMIKYIINTDTGSIKSWDGLPWTETHDRTQEQGAI